MAKDYQRQWQDITDTIDEAKAVRILAEILVEKEGRTFISSLERKDAELCIEILDHVRCDMHLFPLSPSQMISAGHRRAQPQKHRETGLLRHIAETLCTLWATAIFHDNNSKD